MLREGVRYDLVHGHFWMSGWVATELQRLQHIPSVQLFHATGKTKRRYQQTADRSPCERIPTELVIVRTANRLIAQCPQERYELLHDYGADPAKISLIPGAVNIRTFYPVERAEARQKIGLATDGPVIVYIGRVLPRKDIRNVVHALKLLMNQYALEKGGMPVTLLIVGGETEDADPRATPEIGVLQNLAQELDLEQQVRFVGKCQPETLRYYYSAGDVAVTTPWYEPFGLTPLEAMACERPVVGSAVGGITSTVIDGQTGFLVPPRDPEILAARLYDLLTNTEKRARMGKTARARVEQEFTWSVTARRTTALYESLIARPTSTITPVWTPQSAYPALSDGQSASG
jgi:hypothetical protein